MIRKWLDRLLDKFSMIVLGILTVVTSIQILNRYIIQYPLEWTEEIARFLLIWAVLFGAVLCVRDDNHIEMDFFYYKMSQKIKHFLTVVGTLVFIVFNIFVVWQGMGILKIIRFQKASASHISMAWVYIAGPLSALLMIIYLGDRLLKLIKGSQSHSSGKSETGKEEDIR